MLFDTLDFEFLRLTGLCRYMPAGLYRKYDAPYLSKRVISNLQEYKLIKLMSDKQSYKLTKKGRDILEKMNLIFAKDARTNLKKASYIRKLKNADWNVLLSLAGINVYYKTARELSGLDCGYMSSLLLRSDNSMKVLSGTKFLGILKIAEIAYIPYCIESRNSWVYPMFEREIYRAQTDAIRDVKDIKLILAGETLEELWSDIRPVSESVKSVNGQKPFYKALEEMGSEYLLAPLSREGVLQLNIVTACRYRERIAKAIGCAEREVSHLSDCDGIKNDIPYIIGVDFNVKRIIRALKQIERYNKKLIPTICCLPFQKGTLLKVLHKYHTSKAYVIPISINDIYSVFPEIKSNAIKKEAIKTKEGDYIDVPEKPYSKSETKATETRKNK